MHYTRRQLQLFLALAETGSITGAARICHVTQPSVSMQLRDLAESVGLPLVEQIGKRLFLTEAGRALARRAQAMAHEWDAFEQEIAALQGLQRGRLSVSMVSTAKYFIPDMLGSFCAGHPEVDIALEVLNRDGVVARLQDNRDDIYVMSQPPQGMDLEVERFLPNPLVLVAPAAHRLAGRRRLGLDFLQQERFILREEGSGTRMACEAHFRACGFEPRVRLALGSNEAIKHAVASGLGLSVISRHALARDPAQEGLCVLPVKGFPIHANWQVVVPRGKRLSPLAQAFREHLRSTSASRMPLPSSP